MEILSFLEAIRRPLWNAVFSAVTCLGDETFAIALVLFVYWCISKKWGCYTLIVMFFSLFINQVGKILCRVPRPWVRHPGFTVVENALVNAEGYSFPSGHTANIVGTLGSLARFEKKRWLTVLCVILIAAVSFSRMYLGAHYPSDVLFSLAVGSVLVFALYPLYAAGSHISRRIMITFLLTILLSLGFAAFLHLHTWPADIQTLNLIAAQKNSFMMVGLCLGMIVGIIFDRNVIDFRVAAPRWAQVLKTLVGLILVVAVRGGLKQILPSALWWTAPRYFLTAIFASCVWPLTFPWFARGCRRKQAEPA